MIVVSFFNMFENLSATQDRLTIANDQQIPPKTTQNLSCDMSPTTNDFQSHGDLNPILTCRILSSDCGFSETRDYRKHWRITSNYIIAFCSIFKYIISNSLLLKSLMKHQL